jgi:hypothetical protein
MLAGTVLDRVSSMNDLMGVIMDDDPSDAMLEFIRRLSFEYTLRFLYTVWSPFYDVRVDKVECLQRKFIRYALRSLGWMDFYDLPPYEHRYAILCLDACIMFIFDILSSKW